MNIRNFRLSFLIVFIVLLFAGCTVFATITDPGSLGAWCTSQDTCDDGLICSQPRLDGTRICLEKE